MVPPPPTAQTSLAPLPDTLCSSLVVTPLLSAKVLPSQWRIVPFSPTTQTSSIELPQTPRSTSVVPLGWLASTSRSTAAPSPLPHRPGLGRRHPPDAEELVPLRGGVLPAPVVRAADPEGAADVRRAAAAARLRADTGAAVHLATAAVVDQAAVLLNGRAGLGTHLHRPSLQTWSGWHL